MSQSLELVEQTIQSARDGIVVVCGPKSKPRPITDAERDAIEKTNAKLPKSMWRWLEFDAPSMDLFDSDGNPTAVTTLNGFLQSELAAIMDEVPEEFAEEIAAGLEYMLGDYAGLADLPAIVLPPSASQAHILVLDGSDEPKVLGYEKEEFWEKYPSFGACIAHIIGNRDYAEIGPDWAKPDEKKPSRRR